jgi:hypothetical protein
MVKLTVFYSVIRSSGPGTGLECKPWPDYVPVRRTQPNSKTDRNIVSTECHQFTKLNALSGDSAKIITKCHDRKLFHRKKSSNSR